MNDINGYSFKMYPKRAKLILGNISQRMNLIATQKRPKKNKCSKLIILKMNFLIKSENKFSQDNSKKHVKRSV